MDFILKSPVISEKSIKMAKDGWYTFLVDRRATKPIIGQVISKKFGVKVIEVKSANLKGEKKSQRGKMGKFMTADLKKATVKLKSGQRIDLFDVEASKEEDISEQPKEKTAGLLRGTKVKIERTSKSKKINSKEIEKEDK